MAETNEIEYPSASDSTNRYRSWLLVKLANPDDAPEVANKIFKEVGNPKQVPEFFSNDYPGLVKEDIVVIRADSVKFESGSLDIHLIVPVDLSSEKHLGIVKEYIQKVGGEKVYNAKVDFHFPLAPYFSNGYISEEEREIGVSEYKVPPVDDPGLTRNSPGDNPWG